jgi:hypothetical protein
MERSRTVGELVSLLEHDERVADATEAVIKAAEALKRKLDGTVPGFCLDEIGDVVVAVEAMQAERGE